MGYAPLRLACFISQQSAMPGSADCPVSRRGAAACDNIGRRTTMKGISPCLWFDGQAESAADFYIGVFRNARITAKSYYGEAGQEFHGKPPGRDRKSTRLNSSH